MVHGRIGGQAGDGGQHAEGVAGEEDHRGGLAARALEAAVGNVLDGVAHAGVLREGDVVVVGVAVLVEDDVLAQGAELDGAEDLGLALLGEAVALGIAAALDVEDALAHGPAVLVVTDEQALGVGGQGGLAGAGQAEEDGGVVRGGVHGGRAVHGQHVVLDGQEVVHGGEDGLLDFAGVLGAGDDHGALGEVDEHGASEFRPSMAGSHL